MTIKPPLIQYTGVEKTFHNGSLHYHALKGIDLTINHGEFIAIVGPSGSGKSTAMHLMGLLDRPSKGTYHLNGVDTTSLSSNERAHWRNERIGFIFQQFFLLPKFNALDNVLLPLRYREKPLPDPQSIARQILTDVGMASHEKHRPYELSGGQQQRVAIARALVSSPDIVLADEPTGALDTKTGDDVLKLLKDLQREKKTTVIIVTHDLHVANQCDRIIQIQDGLIKSDQLRSQEVE